MKQYGRHDLRSYLDDGNDLWSDDDEYASDYDDTYDQGETAECDKGRQVPLGKASTEQPTSKPPPAFLLSDAFESSVVISEEKKSQQSKLPPSIASPDVGSSGTKRPSPDNLTNKKTAVASIVVPYVRPRREEIDGLRRNGEDVFSTLDDDAIVRIAAHLPLQDVSSLSCASRYLDVALSSDYLYCRRTEKESTVCGEDVGEGVASILPSLRDAENFLLPYGPSRPRGVSRKYALEAQAYGPSVHKSCTFRLVEEISNVSPRPNDVKLVDQFTLAYTSGAPEIVIHRLPRRSSSSAAAAAVAATATTIPPPRTVVALPGCADVRRSAFGLTRRGLCATLSGASYSSNGDGGGGTVLSVTDLSSKSVSWQKRVEGPRTTIAAAFKPSSLEFGGANDEWLLVNAGGGLCSVLDVACGGVELWSMNEEEESADGPLDSCLFFDDMGHNGDGGGCGPSSSPLVVGMRGGSIKIYDVRQSGGSTAGASTARADPMSSLSAPSTVVHAAVLGGRLFAASHGGRLFCGTPFTATTTTTDRSAFRGRADEKTIRSPTSFQMDEVKGAPSVTSMTVGNGKLYLCNGGKIDVIDPRMMSSLWASHEQCGSPNIDAVVVDDTKLILRSTPPFSNSQSVKIVPMDAFAQNSRLRGPVEVRFPHLNRVSTWLNVGTLALRGNLLAVPLSFDKEFYEQTNGGTIERVRRRDYNVIRVLDIQHVDEYQDSYRAVRSENSAQWELKNMYQNQLYVEKNAKELEEEARKKEEEETTEAERAEKISRRKEAKKEAGRRFKATEKASSKQRAFGKRMKDAR